MTALYAVSDNSNPRHNLVRSCLNDRDIDDRETCLDGTDAKCFGCTGTNCNTVALPEIRHTCYRCLGEACEDPEPEECIVYKEDDKCFMRFEAGNNNAVELGCLSDFDSDETITELVKQKALFICEGANCNGFEHLPKTFDCNICTSNEDESCATNPTTITTESKCITMPYTQCYQRITGGDTERGCLSELEGDVFYNCLTGADEKCKICEGNNCNDEVLSNI